jgi:hypothetical protein
MAEWQGIPYASPKASEANSWLKYITDFDALYDVFDDNYNALLAIGPEVNRNPGIIPNYDQLVNDGAVYRQRLIALKDTRDYMASWINWLSSGAQGVFDYARAAIGLNGRGFGLAEMGALQLVPLAVFAAFVATVGYYLKDVYIAAQRWNAFQAERNRGKSPAEALATANRLFPQGSLFGNIFGGEVTGYILLAALAYLIGPAIIKAISGGRND